MNTIQQRLHQQLQERERAGSLRRLSVGLAPVDFCSNDYLGLARNQTLRKRIEQATSHNESLLNGATGSRLISGNSDLALTVELELAAVFKGESSLLFNSGYTANLAVMATLPQKGDTILCDELIHASLREGTRLSYAQRYSFRHNDLADLEKKIQHARRGNAGRSGVIGECFVVAESVYSMDGDFGDLPGLLAVCEAYGAHLIWDEAHSTGVWGEAGSGWACSLGLHDRIFARIYTFGKAMGIHGACVAGSNVLIHYLINFARSFIYTTAMPPHSLVSIRESFDFLKEQSSLQKTLADKIALFTQCTHGIQEKMIPSQSPIQIVQVGGNEATKAFAKKVQQAGFDVRPILSPTVKAGEERLRICLHVHNTDDEIRALARVLSNA